MVFSSCGAYTGMIADFCVNVGALMKITAEFSKFVRDFS